MATALSSVAMEFTPTQNFYEAAIASELKNAPEVAAVIPFGLELKAQDPNPHCTVDRAVNDGWGKRSSPTTVFMIASVEKLAVAARGSKIAQEIVASYATEAIIQHNLTDLLEWEA